MSHKPGFMKFRLFIEILVKKTVVLHVTSSTTPLLLQSVLLIPQSLHHSVI